jgi:hypothetical protein
MFIQRVPIILSVFSLFLFMTPSCKKDSKESSYTCTTCVTAAQAVAANDASSKGIYKGVFIGSSGIISFDVMNNGTTITAKMVIDGITVNLSSSITWVAGQAYVAPFTGTYNGSPVSITFSVNANGGSPVVTTSSIPGHPSADFSIAKETSNSLIEGFEGTYHTSAPKDGTFNLLLSRVARVWGAEARDNGTTTSNSAGGTITTDSKIVETNGTVMGTLTSDEINGSFTDGGGKTVTITAKRTL